MSTLEIDQLDNFELGKKAALAGEIEQARQLLRPIADLNPFHPAAYFLCYVESSKGSILNCEKYTLTFLSKHPHHAGMRTISAKLNAAKGDLDQSEKDLKIALNFNPNHQRALKLQEQIQVIRAENSARDALLAIESPKSHPAFSSYRKSKAAKQLSKVKPIENWDNHELQAKIAFFYNSQNLRRTLKNYDSELISSAVKLGYCTWPRKLQNYIRGRSVLDVGCRFGGHAMGYLCAGASSYMGIDPAMSMDAKVVRSKRIRNWVYAPMSSREIMEVVPDIKLHQCSTRDLVGSIKFDAISLHNVTEHLVDIEDVFEDITKLLNRDGKIIYLHHNFYGWSGHHMPPHTPAALDENNPEHLKYCDWKHINLIKELPRDHYLYTDLNRVRIDKLKSITNKYFNIEEWELWPSNDKVLERLTPKIENRIKKEIPDITLDEIKTNVVFCVATAK